MGDYWRCPHCSGILKKGMSGIMDDFRRTGGEMIGGSASCERCGGSVSQSKVYNGKYDVPTLQINCPNCSTGLVGAKEMLSGKSCPSCGNRLPTSGFNTL